MIDVQNISFHYPEKDLLVLNQISFRMKPGERIGLMGANGSGKTTFIQCLNGLLTPQQGDVIVDGWSVRDEAQLASIRKSVGMVFQNPDHQMVATTLEREIAFGLENLGIPREEMQSRVADALERFQLTAYQHTEPHLLSGGERQRLALAGVWVMHPQYYVLDEPTSLLDPAGREMVLTFLKEEAAEGRGFLLVTQHPEETLHLDRLLIFHEGEILLEGPPQDVFTQLFEQPDVPVSIPSEYGIARQMKALGYVYSI